MTEKTLTEALADAWIQAIEAYAKRAHEIRETYAHLPAEVKAEIQNIPRIDLAELEELPWSKWKKDQEGKRIPADPGEPGWIKNPAYFTGFEAPAVQLELVKALKRTDGKLEFGEWIFGFSGRDDMFITRKIRAL